MKDDVSFYYLNSAIPGGAKAFSSKNNGLFFTGYDITPLERNTASIEIAGRRLPYDITDILYPNQMFNNRQITIYLYGKGDVYEMEQMKCTIHKSLPFQSYYLSLSTRFGWYTKIHPKFEFKVVGQNVYQIIITGEVEPFWVFTQAKTSDKTCFGGIDFENDYFPDTLSYSLSLTTSYQTVYIKVPYNITSLYIKASIDCTASYYRLAFTSSSTSSSTVALSKNVVTELDRVSVSNSSNDYFYVSVRVKADEEADVTLTITYKGESI